MRHRGWSWLVPVNAKAVAPVLILCATTATTLGLPRQARAALNANCVVSVLNRSAYVKADGSWVLPNVPANIGRVRVRATCVESGITRSGQSEFLSVPANGVIKVGDIPLDAPEPVPARLVLSAPETTLGTVGATVQLTATATYPDGRTADVTLAARGTNYTASNSRIASVGADGLVTAVSSGTAIITALSDGASGLLRVQVVLGGDTDGDGISDDVELANGLNPNDPVDALEDFDRDGLTNFQELQLGTDLRNGDTDGDTLPDGREVTLGTDPFLFDTDGDGLGDGLEVATGSDPLDPASYNLALALQSLEVKPTAAVLVVNTLIGEASRQLRVTGHLIDGRTLDLTSTSRRTNYASSDLTVVNFGGVDGQIFAGNNGSATVSVSNSGYAASVQVVVRSFTPAALSYVAIPGYANNVDVAGNYAYVAAGATGLQVVDVSDHRAPRVVAALDTPGNANDVFVAGGLAYVADGAAGLQVIDVGNPLAPVLRGALDTPGIAQDVVVRGARAYVADGTAGLRVMDISNPASPVLLGALDTAGTAKGVDVSGDIAVVADGTGGVRVVSVADPFLPTLRGSLATTDARDVALDGTVAYVSDYTGSLRVVDVSTPTAPRLLATTVQSLGGILMDVVKAGNLTFAADVYFVNGVPITDVSVPASPQVRARLDFPARDDNGTGIAVDASYVYLTADRGIVENGTSGDTRLYIGQYFEVVDDAGVPPTVTFTAPAPGSQHIAGTTTTLRVTAADDVAVASVTFAVGGVPVFTDLVAPFEYAYTFPAAAGPVTLTATALDFGENQGQGSLTVEVTPDPAPVAELTSPAAGASVMEGATIQLAATASDNIKVTQVRFLVDGSAVATDTTAPYQASYVVPVGAATLEVVAEASDNLGQIGVAARSVPVVPDPPPAVAIAAPPAGGALVEGETIALTASATDNVAVARVDFAVEGLPLSPDTVAPYVRSFRVPEVGGLTVSATATDNLGRSSTPAWASYTVGPDPLTTVQGRVVDGAGNPVADATVVIEMHGVKAEFFDFDAPLAGLPDLAGRTPDATRLVSSIDFRNPGHLFGSDTFGVGLAPYLAARFTGLIKVASTGSYRFTLGADDGARLLVRGSAVAEVAAAGPYSEVSGVVSLNAGTHPIEVLYYQNDGDAELQLSLTPPGQERDAVGAANLLQSPDPFTVVTDAAGAFSVTGVPTALGGVRASASATLAGEELAGRSEETPPVRGGLTDLGTITLRPATTSVLILSDASTPGTTALVNALVAAGNTVTLRPPPEYTWDGTNPPLDGFSVVIHLNGATYSTPLPVAAQNALVNFVANGGGFIGSQWNGYERVQNRQLNMADLVMQLWSSGAQSENGCCSLRAYNVVPGQETHPVTAGVPSSFTFFADGHDAGNQIVYSINPSTVLMRVPSGGPAVLVRQFGSGRVVNFSAAPNYEQSGRTLQDPNIQRLYINAVAWAGGGG